MAIVSCQAREEAGGLFGVKELWFHYTELGPAVPVGLLKAAAAALVHHSLTGAEPRKPILGYEAWKG